MTDTQKSHPIRDALFLDIPYILDSVARHAEYTINRLYVPALDGAAPRRKSYLALPSFWLLLVVLFLTAYGPTYNAVCGLLEPAIVVSGTHLIGMLLVAAAVAQFVVTFVYFHLRIRRRFEKQKQLSYKGRYWFVHVLFLLALGAAALPLGWFGKSLLGDLPGGCHPHTAHGPAIVQLASLFLVALLATVASLKASTDRLRLFAQAVAIVALLLMTFLTPVDGPRSEAAQVPYPHVFGVVAAGLGIIAWLATWLVNIPLGSVSDEERSESENALKVTELFPGSRDDPSLSFRRIAGGLVTAVIAKPLQFLLLPAFAIVLAPADYLWHAVVLSTCAAAMLLTAGSLTSRWDRMSQYLRRYFLLGTPFAVSASVIVVAALRLGGVQYVTTLLNVAPFGMLFIWMVMAYALCWWFEYQVNGVLAAKLLGIFGAPGDRSDALVDYNISGEARDLSRVERGGRYLTGHGLGELVAVGVIKENRGGQKTPAFHAYTALELFEALLGRDHPNQAHEIGRRVQLYFAMVNLLVAIGLGTLAWNWGRGDRLNTVQPVVTASQMPATPATPAAPGEATADLAALLSKHSGSPEGSAIVVAASGGGTRAALYTAMTLQGLHNLGVDDRIVLLSGVSGGSVAAAYFYGHRDSLVHSGDTEGCTIGDTQLKSAWDCYVERMAMPFIDDVLRGAAEWRIQSEQPLGVLLAESFERRLFADGKKGIGQRTDVGLILNTTVTGHPIEDSPALEGTLALPKQTRASGCGAPVNALGGGRLAFSNLAQISAFSKQDESVPAIGMPFLVLRDPTVELARAAALSANFPPVFPNARVDVTGFSKGADSCDVRTYFVTDGGAMENLSLVSALLAIESAVRTTSADVKLRDIDIVLAEASAFEFDYAQDRGVGAATGQAKERITGRLSLELIEKLAPRVKINLHDLSAPRVFRSRGGFGTHWQWPGTVRLENPLESPVPPAWKRIASQYTGTERHWVTVDRKQLFQLWRALYAKEGSICGVTWTNDTAADLTTVSRWICGHDRDGKEVARPDPQVGHWARLKAHLAPH